MDLEYEVTDEALQHVHRIFLDTLKTINELCNRHHISYFLSGGTLLGAIRHKGFIPWDDDLDIAMLRADYEVFIKVAMEELPGEYFFQTHDTDEGYPFPFAKVRVNGTKWVEAACSHLDIHQGVFIDIFPCDNIPDNIIHKLFHKLACESLIRLCRARQKVIMPTKYPRLKPVIYNTLYLLLKPFSVKSMVRKLDRIMKLYSSNQTKYVASIPGGYGYDRQSMPTNIIEPVCLVQFEDGEFYAPKDWNTFLTRMYGDYMTPPPENQRGNQHGIIEYKF